MRASTVTRTQRRANLAGRRHKSVDVGLGIEVRSWLPSPAGQQAARRDLMAGIDGMEVAGKDPHHTELLGPPSGSGVGNRCRPVECQADGEAISAHPVGIGHEVGQQLAVTLQLVAH